jgi:quinol monooxygenase YgiN
VIIVTGHLDFPKVDRAQLLAGLADVTRLSRQDDGCVDYWWAEDSEVEMRFHFFECWESPELFEAHRVQPFEDVFNATFVARASGAQAHIYDGSNRRQAT